MVIAQKVKRNEGDFSNEAKQMKWKAQQARAPSAMKVHDDENKDEEDEASFMQTKGRRSAVKRSQSVMGGGPARASKLGNAKASR